MLCYTCRSCLQLCNSSAVAQCSSAGSPSTQSSSQKDLGASLTRSRQCARPLPPGLCLRAACGAEAGCVLTPRCAQQFHCGGFSVVRFCKDSLGQTRGSPKPECKADLKSLLRAVPPGWALAGRVSPCDRSLPGHHPAAVGQPACTALSRSAQVVFRLVRENMFSWGHLCVS